MQELQVKPGQIVSFEEAFPGRFFGQHGTEQVRFIGADVVCMRWNSGGKLLKQADFDSGDSVTGATLGPDRDYIFSTEPGGMGHVLGVVEYRNGDQPRLYEGSPLKPAVGGSNRFSSFVSETGAAEEDPKPRLVNDGETPETYEYNRLTGQAAWGDHYVTIRALDPGVNELQLQTMGTNPPDEDTFPKPDTCPTCGN